MGVGSPEYIIPVPASRKLTGLAVMPMEPVKKSKRDYRALAGSMRTPSGVAAETGYHGGRNGRLWPDKLASMYTSSACQNVYDYEHHVKRGEDLELRGALPSTFMSLAPGSHHPDVWHDISRMLTLNGDSSRNRAVEQHAMPFADRYSQAID